MTTTQMGQMTAITAAKKYIKQEERKIYQARTRQAKRGGENGGAGVIARQVKSSQFGKN